MGEGMFTEVSSVIICSTPRSHRFLLKVCKPFHFFQQWIMTPEACALIDLI